MVWTWLEWTLLLSPVAFVLIGSALIGAGIALRRRGSIRSTLTFRAGVGAYVGGIACSFAWSVDQDAGRMAFVTVFFAITAVWILGCLIAAARTKEGADAAASAPSHQRAQSASTR